MTTNQGFQHRTPKPTSAEQTSALVDAFVDILWKVSTPLKRSSSNPTNQTELRQIVVTLVGFEPCFQTKRTFVEDGFTEKVRKVFQGKNTKLQ